jgi:pilus assembly protein Flp/PilA
MILNTFLQKFRRDERGVSALEYAILAAIVVAAVAALSPTIKGFYTSAFSTIQDKITTAVQ